ncbi:Fanconi anemia group J protein homolog isoform X2 [Copidosoma floridanum]|uniref:Fanconi anemia group J protein homolog isoform X2 n=1 Tax=Copidosoma floridanum TaxID=29053 RepID=UPI0006C9664F|nr:Fanconi anemia group J protein homolog isoform X2 [Copidosoma floridanum]
MLIYLFIVLLFCAYYTYKYLDNDELFSLKSESPKPRDMKRGGLFKWEPMEQKQAEKKRKVDPVPIETIDLSEDEPDNKWEERPVPSQVLEKKIHTDNPLPPEMCGGMAVKFPVTPYGSQKTVMSSVVKGCKNSQHCLLESPTGSGKTLALLCATLAWQQEEKAKLYDAACEESLKNQGDADNFKEDVFDPEKFNVKQKDIPITPKIFYGTRTHKQIEQVIRELKKTAYSNVGMTILSSREHTCIQPKENGVSLTQLCNNLLDPKLKKGCQYYGSKNSRWNELNSPWDIEDLVAFGRDEGSCPYFAARSMMDTADIIFCPYNYLIDPVIRDTMQIKLKGHIVIIDEAHNIENSCREVASTSFREDHLEEVSEDCKFVFSVTKHEAYQDIQYYIDALINVIHNQTLPSNNLQHPFDEVTSKWLCGSTAWMQLKEIHKLGPPRYTHFHTACQYAFKAYNDMKENVPVGKENQKKKHSSTITFASKKLLEELLLSLEAIQNATYQNDFRVVTALSYHKDAKTKTKENEWIQTKNRKPVALRTLKFECMNSAMIFRQLSRSCRSMILASGTLTPTSTFESELGTKFTFKLHANHVINPQQVYARVVPRGPTGHPLKAIYSEIQTLPFKDELGRLLIDVCQSVPHGVLCFFSSYNVLNEMLERWKSTDVYDNLEMVKRIILEPRFSTNYDQVMDEFRSVILETSDGPVHGVTGALLLGVFRGKMAEGIDFSDNEARCVVTVGIPYPNTFDAKIKMKREYNDQHHQDIGLMKGSKWYDVQAYRALNQALGRCIRHKNDWGAVLLVDARLNESSEYLPKWIRETMKNQKNYDPNDLKKFVQNRKQHDRQTTLRVSSS